MKRNWIAQRSAGIDSSGIRRVFDLAANMHDPIDLSIGQPDFDVPRAIQDAAIEAIRSGKNGYSVTQGIASLRAALQSRVAAKFGHADRTVLITSGTSGALVLALLATIDPGDEVIVFDPYFVMYEALVGMVGGRCVLVDTYPEFRIDIDRVAAAMSGKTKMILLGTPANPTGVVASEQEVRDLAELAARHEVLLVSDEIYGHFCYDGSLVSPASYDESCLVLDGFSKTYGVTGWRLGFAHGPAQIIEVMTMLQQYTFVCAPQPAQWAGVAALDVDMRREVATFRRRRDLLIAGLADDYELVRPGGAFYLFPQVPWGTGTEFVRRAIDHELLIIPGNVFSRRDTHFRISYAADETTIARGIDVLQRLARFG
ncbi:MAG: aspartate aminotransferase [Planctomycetes bacterium RBG_16_64_10]|nr:MAG: aspartate aminotransferase [Planctomycetes bacterium RBG_16_64_10]